MHDDSGAPDLAALLRHDGLTEAALLEALTRRIGAWLSGDAAALWQALYRMDVAERGINAALGTAAPARELARLVLERAREKAAARARTRGPKPPPGDELAW